MVECSEKETESWGTQELLLLPTTATDSFFMRTHVSREEVGMIGHTFILKKLEQMAIQWNVFIPPKYWVL